MFEPNLEDVDKYDLPGSDTAQLNKTLHAKPGKKGFVSKYQATQSINNDANCSIFTPIKAPQCLSIITNRPHSLVQQTKPYEFTQNIETTIANPRNSIINTHLNKTKNIKPTDKQTIYFKQLKKQLLNESTNFGIGASENLTDIFGPTDNNNENVGTNEMDTTTISSNINNDTTNMSNTINGMESVDKEQITTITFDFSSPNTGNNNQSNNYGRSTNRSRRSGSISPKKRRQQKKMSRMRGAIGKQTSTLPALSLPFLKEILDVRHKLQSRGNGRIHTNRLSAGDTTSMSQTPSQEMSMTQETTTVNQDPAMLEYALVTGQDAIEFFVKHQSNTPIKFVYCNRNDNSNPNRITNPYSDPDSEQFPDFSTALTGQDEFNPYDLLVVHDAEDLNDEYYTISATGVTRTQPGKPTETMSLSRWIYESTIFSILKSIPSFRYYMLAKCFRFWRSNVRYLLYKKQRIKIESNLFLNKKSFQSPLVEINSILQDMQEWTFFVIQGSKKYSQNEFENEQISQRNDIMKKIEEVSDNLKLIVQEAVDGVKIRAQKQFDNDELVLSKHVSMVKAKEQQEARIQFLKKAQNEANRLGDFIRLVDYMIISNLTLLAINSIYNLRDILKMPRQRKIGLFITHVSFNDENNDVNFSIDVEDINSMINSIVNNMVDAMDVIPRILYFTAFKPLVLCSYNRSLLRYEKEYVNIILSQFKQNNNLNNSNIKDKKDIKFLHSMPGMNIRNKRISLINDPMTFLLNQQQYDQQWREEQEINDRRRNKRSNKHNTMIHYSDLNYQQLLSNVSRMIATEFVPIRNIEGPNLANIIRNSHQFVNCFENIQDTIKRDFLETQETAEQFIPYRRVYSQYQKWNFENYKNETKSDIHKLASDIDDQTKWSDKIERQMMAQFHCGMYFVDARNLKETLRPMSEAMLKDTEKLLLQLFHEKCNDALTLYNGNLQDLDNQTQTLELFANHVKKVSNVKGALIDIKRSNDEVDILFGLIKQNSVEMPLSDKVLLEDLQSVKEKFDMELLNQENLIQSIMPDYVEQVYKQIQDISNTIEDMLQLFTPNPNNIFINIQTQPKDALIEIGKIEAKFKQECLDNIDKVHYYQKLFGRTKYEFKTAQQMQSKLDKLNVFWKLYNQYKIASTKYEAFDIENANFDSMFIEMKQFHRDAVDIVNSDRMSLSSSVKVSEKLESDIKAWLTQIPQVKSLVQASLQPQHWSSLFKACNTKYTPNSKITFKKLTNAKVFSKPNLIQQTIDQTKQDQN